MTFCQSKGGIPYFETSAKEAINVEQAFEGMYMPEPFIPRNFASQLLAALYLELIC
jgi:hypothetical protein